MMENITTARAKVNQFFAGVVPPGSQRHEKNVKKNAKRTLIINKTVLYFPIGCGFRF